MKRIQNVIIVGAGISGTALGISFAKHGINVTILERDSEFEHHQEDERSANFTITNRGLILLEKIGIDQEVRLKSKELLYRVIHHKDKILHQKYGSGALDHPRSIQRSDLLQILQSHASSYLTLNIHFNSHVTGLERKSGSVIFSNAERAHNELNGDLIIGADGAFSTIRQLMTHGTLINTSISYFDWVYKKLVFSASEVKELNLDLNGLHVWTKKRSVLFGLPNLNKSIACIFCAQFDKKLDLQSKASAEHFFNLFRLEFPDLQHCSHLLESFHKAKISGLVNIQMSSFHYQEKVVLVGDACHAVFPFYGQGMNAALEDCLTLINLLEKYQFILRPEPFLQYDTAQKQSADALQQLSTTHFFELRDHANSSLFEAKVWTSSLLEKMFPKIWKNEYSLIVRGETSYDQALKKMQRQNIYKWLFLIKFLEFLLIPIIFFKRSISTFAWFKKD